MTICSRSGHVSSAQSPNWQQALTAVLASERGRVVHSSQRSPLYEMSVGDYHTFPVHSQRSRLPCSCSNHDSKSRRSSRLNCLCRICCRLPACNMQRALKIALNNASESSKFMYMRCGIIFASVISGVSCFLHLHA